MDSSEEHNRKFNKDSSINKIASLTANSKKLEILLGEIIDSSSKLNEAYKNNKYAKISENKIRAIVELFSIVNVVCKPTLTNLNMILISGEPNKSIDTAQIIKDMESIKRKNVRNSQSIEVQQAAIQKCLIPFVLI